MGIISTVNQAIARAIVDKELTEAQKMRCAMSVQDAEQVAAEKGERWVGSVAQWVNAYCTKKIR